jgi:hypothetical protein
MPGLLMPAAMPAALLLEKLLLHARAVPVEHGASLAAVVAAV